MQQPDGSAPFESGALTDSSASALCALIQEQHEILWAIYLEATEPPGKVSEKAHLASFLLLNALHLHQMATAATTLMECGRPFSVVILARSALESMFNLRAAVEDREFGPQRLAHEMDDLARKLRFLRENDYWPHTRHPTPEECEREASEIRKLYKLPPLAKRTDVDRIAKVERIAQIGGLSPYYDDDYRHLSLAVHGNQAGIINAAHGFLVKKALLALSNALFIGAKVISGVFRVKKFHEKLNSHHQRIERLMLSPDFLPTANQRVGSISERQWKDIPFHDPQQLLHEILPDVTLLLQRPLECPEETKRRRKQILGQYQAALLGFVVQEMSGQHAKITLAMTEQSDFDCVLKGTIESQSVYKPVQLKELPSHETNQHSSLDETVSKLQKYSGNLLVSIWINRDVKFRLEDIDVTKLKFEQLFLVGDRPDGSVEIHGGTITDWQNGQCWEGILRHGQPSIRPITFRPRPRS